MTHSFSYADERPELVLLAGLKKNIKVRSFRDESRRANTYRFGLFSSLDNTKEFRLSDKPNEIYRDFLEREAAAIRSQAKKRWRMKL